MTLGHHIRRTLVLGLPLVASQVAQMTIGLTDTLMLGRYSVAALAAGTIGNSMFFILFIAASGFAIACMPMASDALGRDDEVRVRRVARMGLWLSGGMGLLLLPLFWWSGPLLLVLGQDAQVAADGQAYLRIAGAGIVPALLVMTLRSHLSALERTRIVMVATLAALVLNVGLNWLLIFGNLGFPEMGIRGAAVASLGVQLLMLGVLAAYATRGPGMARFDLWRNLHRPDWPILAEIARLGLPIGLTLIAESAMFAGSTVMMGWIGPLALGAHGIALGIAGLTFMVHLGLSQAATVRIGRAWGQGAGGDVRSGALAAAILSGVAIAAVIALYLAAGPWLVGLFLDRSDPRADEILALGVSLLTLAAIFQAVDAGQVMALGFLRGVQDTRVPMVYAMLSYFGLGIPACYVLAFPLGYGPQGLWMGLTVGLLAANAALLTRFLGLMRMPQSRVTSRS